LAAKISSEFDLSQIPLVENSGQMAAQLAGDANGSKAWTNGNSSGRKRASPHDFTGKSLLHNH
jgi:hypothetical protein